MSGGHTLGPWEATERHDYHEIIGPRQNSDWFGRKNVWAVAYADTDRDIGEQIANARLIAAAPELLEAAMAMLPSNIALGNAAWPDSQIVPIDFTLGELRALRAAIAKATVA